MLHPEDDLLADLALDGSDDAPTPELVRAHVGACSACSSSVSQLRRTLSLVRTTASDGDWVQPMPALWEAISAQLQHPAPASATDTASAPAASADADADTSSATAPGGAQVSSLARRRDHRDRRSSGRASLVGWTAGIAAAGLALGLITGRALWSEPAVAPPAAVATTPAAPTSTTVSQVALNTLDTTDPKQLGQAAVTRAATGYELSIDTARPVDAGSGYLEVWLINRDLKRMVSVGLLRPTGVASFPISQNLIDQGYVVVDVSRQQFTESNAHSGDSVMRGKLPA